MATYTDNYQLTKPLYSETADVAAINNNMDKIDDIMHASQVSLAPAYDQNETYNTGDVVMYEFLMYECLEDNVTGVWDATKWQRTTAGEHGGGSSASEVSYDNTNSGLEADNVQDAIDEIVENIPSVEANPQGAATEELTKIGIGGTIYEIVGGETIYGKASGAVANFDDGSANPLVDLKIQITASQGSGTPSPSNPLPISGWEGANVTVAGKNLANLTYGDKVPSISTGEMVSSYGWSSDFLKLDKNTTYVLSSSLPSRYVLFYDENKTYLGYTVNYSTSGYVLNNSAYWNNTSYIKLRVDASGTATMVVQLEVGSSATAYEPYNATIYPISWQTEAGEVFGGTLDVTTGELTITHGYIASYDGETINEPWISSIDEYVAGTTPSTGAEVVYPLTTPITESITPTQISSLLGTNNIWSDTGDCEVEYIRDINKAFNILWNAVMNSNSGTRSLNLMKGAISETKEDIEEPIKEEEETKEGKDENQR